MHAQPRHSAGTPAVGVVTLMPFVLPGQRSRQLAKSKGLRRDAAAGRGQGAPMGCENADAQGASSYGANVEGQRIKKPAEEHPPSCSLAARARARARTVAPKMAGQRRRPPTRR